MAREQEIGPQQDRPARKRPVPAASPVLSEWMPRAPASAPGGEPPVEPGGEIGAHVRLLRLGEDLVPRARVDEGGDVGEAGALPVGVRQEMHAARAADGVVASDHEERRDVAPEVAPLDDAAYRALSALSVSEEIKRGVA